MEAPLHTLHRRTPPLQHGTPVLLPDGRQALLCHAYFVLQERRWRAVVRVNNRRAYYWIEELQPAPGDPTAEATKRRNQTHPTTTPR